MIGDTQGDVGSIESTSEPSRNLVDGAPAETQEYSLAIVERFREALLSRKALPVLLIMVLLVAAVLRLTGVNWDQGQHLHPDERFLTMVESSLRLPQSIGEYFDSLNSPLNPYNTGFDDFVYGTLPIFLVRLVAEIVQRVDYSQVHLVGRVMSALVDLATIIVIFVIARRLYGRKVALLTSLLLAFTVLPIQQSHYFTVDNFTTFFVVLAFYFAIDLAEGKGWHSWAMLGIALGMALASKVSVFLFGCVIVLAAVMRVVGVIDKRGALSQYASLEWRWFGLDFSVRPVSDEGGGNASRLMMLCVRLLLILSFVVLMAFLSFRVFQPYSFAGTGFFDIRLNPEWLNDMISIGDLMKGRMDYPPSHYWTQRADYLFPLQNMILWGMGPCLGITAWLGVLLAVAEVVWRRRWVHLLPVAWIVLFFGYQGAQFVKSIRYFLPIYPFLVMMAAYLLVRFWDKGQSFAATLRWPLLLTRTMRPAATLLLIVVVGATVAWAMAFTGIYTRPVSRAEASEWIYEHVPAGSVLATEHWDDPLPINLDAERNGKLYQGVQLPLYDTDSQEKTERLLAGLDRADYVILSSDRLIGSISRLPMRYPMTVEYYRLLLSGELGFQQVAQFTSYPSLFGWQINDDTADEGFTVYDHPKVRIFKKTPSYTHQHARDLLTRVSLDNITFVKPVDVPQWKNGAQMTASDRVTQEGGGTWFSIFQRDSLANRVPLLVWYLVVQAIGLLAFPLSFAVFRNLRDRGYIISKALGILVVAYLAWLAASTRLAVFSATSIGLSILGLTAVSTVVLVFQWRALLDYCRRNWRLMLVADTLFAGFFLIFTLVRYGNPDLWHPTMGGEKPMDFAYLNAIVRSTYFPPYDPWFAGGYINYYYFGHVIVATLIKFTGIVPWVAYNLAIPLLFALTGVGAFSVAFNLAAALAGRRSEKGPLATGGTPLVCGLFASLFTVLAGNLGEVRLLLSGLQQVSPTQFKSTIPGLAGLMDAIVGLEQVIVSGKRVPVGLNSWYWDPSRVMPNGEINEFPFFTFLYADLHAHMIVLPFALLAMAAAVNVALRVGGKEKPRRVSYPWLPDGWLWYVCSLGLMGLLLGELRVNNTWDFPAYALLLVGGLTIGEWHLRHRVDLRGIVIVLGSAIAVVLLSSLFYLPFHTAYSSGYSNIEFWHGPRTSISDYLTIHGLFLLAISTYLVILLGSEMRCGLLRIAGMLVRGFGTMHRLSGLLNGLVKRRTVLSASQQLAGCIAMVMAGMLFAGFDLNAFLLPFIVVVAILLFRRDACAAERIVLLLVGLGLCLTAGAEVVVIKGDVGRMNTVFKLYLETWVFWAISSAVALGGIWRYLEYRRPRWEGLWINAFTLLLVAVLLYPVVATSAKVQDRFTGDSAAGLDGMAYMLTSVHVENGKQILLADDYRAINWLLDNVEGSPVVLETPGTPLYRWNSRVSVYTGLPTVIGWDWHQKQQRTILPRELIDRRVADVATIYSDPDWAKAQSLLRQYGVSYIYVGELERIYYPHSGLEKFDAEVGRSLDLVYRNDSVKIYRVRPS